MSYQWRNLIWRLMGVVVRGVEPLSHKCYVMNEMALTNVHLDMHKCYIMALTNMHLDWAWGL